MNMYLLALLLLRGNDKQRKTGPTIHTYIIHIYIVSTYFIYYNNIRRLLLGSSPKYIIFSTLLRTILYTFALWRIGCCSVVGDLASGPQYLQSPGQSIHTTYNLYTILLPIYYYYCIIVCSALMGTPQCYTHFHGPVRYFTQRRHTALYYHYYIHRWLSYNIIQVA